MRTAVGCSSLRWGITFGCLRLTTRILCFSRRHRPTYYPVNGGNKTNWATHQNTRLLSWKFNTIGEYATTYVLPVNTNGFHNNANPVKLPFIPLMNAMVTMQLWPATLGLPEAPKDMMKGVPSTIPGVAQQRDDR